jgi:hypothetical protein
MNFVANALRPEGDPVIIETGRSSLSAADNLARGLGWFSFGLGFAELFGTRRMARAFGLEGSETLIRAYGLREIAAGTACLSTERRFGLWSRVAGDCMDLLTLATALDAPPRQRRNVKLAFLAVIGVTALDVIGARALARQQQRDTEPEDFSSRSGYPGGLDAALALADKAQARRRAAG